MAIYNPLDKFYKSMTGAVSARQNVIFRVKGQFNSVVFVFKKDGEEWENLLPMTKSNDFFELSISFDEGLYFYCFSLDNGNYIGKNNDYLGVITDKPESFQLTVYSDQYCVPKWLKGGIIYQIFPDRFCRSNEVKKITNGKVFHDNWLDTPIYEPNNQGEVLNNDFFGGDIKGIISKLPYLKSLGITAIYLNPIFKANSNHRYDTGNYMEIDPFLGNESDFIALIKNADKFGIKIILDGVFNHTGDDSLYFNKYGNYDSIGAYQSQQSPYYKWYDFTEFPDKYQSWWGIKTLPSVNESNDSYIDFITGKDGVLEHYTKLGIGGWRLDVVDELPAFFVEKIRSAVKRINNEAIIIGEVWEDASNKIAYGVRRKYFQGLELDSVMNYPLKNAIINFVKNADNKALSNVIKQQLDHYPHIVLHSLMNILSTHDTVRLLSAVGEVEWLNKTKSQMAKMTIPERDVDVAKQKLKLASLLQFTLCGVPCVYYGDEIGMQGYVDPLNRKCYPWGEEDQELLSWYKALGFVRSSYSAFIDGGFEEICSLDGLYAFKRFNEESEILVVANAGEKEFLLEFDGELFSLIDNAKYQNKRLIKPLFFDVLVNK